MKENPKKRKEGLPWNSLFSPFPLLSSVEREREKENEQRAKRARAFETETERLLRQNSYLQRKEKVWIEFFCVFFFFPERRKEISKKKKKEKKGKRKKGDKRSFIFTYKKNKRGFLELDEKKGEKEKEENTCSMRSIIVTIICVIYMYHWYAPMYECMNE